MFQNKESSRRSFLIITDGRGLSSIIVDPERFELSSEQATNRPLHV